MDGRLLLRERTAAAVGRARARVRRDGDGGDGVDARFAGVLRFPGDVLGTFDCGMDVHRRHSIEVVGSEGTIFVPSPWQAPEPLIVVTRDGEPGGAAPARRRSLRARVGGGRPRDRQRPAAPARARRRAGPGPRDRRALPFRGGGLRYTSVTFAQSLTWSPSASARTAKSPGSPSLTPRSPQSIMSATPSGLWPKKPSLRRPEHGVGPRAADERRRAPLAEQDVIAVAAEHRVVLGVADQHVGAGRRRTRPRRRGSCRPRPPCPADASVVLRLTIDRPAIAGRCR